MAGTTDAQDRTGDRASERLEALYTPEAVRVDLPLADVGSRALAALLDLMAMSVLIYIVLFLGLLAGGVAGAGGANPWPVVVVVLLLNFLVFWGYPVGWEVALRGRTPGKAALGLRVVTAEGAPIRFRHAAIRGVFALVDFWLLLGIPGLITALSTRRAQRLGDLAAGTVVIRDRTGSTTAAVRWEVPPPLAHYASTLDVGTLTSAELAVVRRFLLRAGSLRPEHRPRVAAELADALADRMGHRPPPGTHPEALLVCVAALGQARGPAPFERRDPTQTFGGPGTERREPTQTFGGSGTQRPEPIPPDPNAGGFAPPT